MLSSRPYLYVILHFSHNLSFWSSFSSNFQNVPGICFVRLFIWLHTQQKDKICRDLRNSWMTKDSDILKRPVVFPSYVYNVYRNKKNVTIYLSSLFPIFFNLKVYERTLLNCHSKMFIIRTQSKVEEIFKEQHWRKYTLATIKII